jgi:hypothetical protein
VTLRSRAGWEAARLLAAGGVFRFSRGSALVPREVWDAAGPLIPRGGALAVSRANHAGRFLSLVVDASGEPVAFVKVARDTPGADALLRERQSLERWAHLVPPPLRAPRLVDHTVGVLVLEPVKWRPRLTPWVMPVNVAHALGAFFRISESGRDPVLGVAHGDCAPWNLLMDASGWALIDWENTADGMPPFYDLFHFLVQSSIELRRPSKASILEALTLRGKLAPLIAAYAQGCDIHPREAEALFVDYLRRSYAGVEPSAPPRAFRIRHELARTMGHSLPRDDN